MFYTTSETGDKLVHIKLVQAPSNSLLTVPRRKVCSGSLLPVFSVKIRVTIYLTCVYIILVRFMLLSGHLFKKKPLTRLTICSLVL